MVRANKPIRFSEKRLADAAVNLLSLGAVTMLAPLLLGTSVFGRALSTLMPLGLIMIMAGGLLHWISKAE